MKYQVAFIGALVVVIGILLYVWFSEPTIPPQPSTNDSFEVVTAYWEAVIQKDGGEAAYQQFLTWAAPTNINVQHGFAHVIGGALYDLLGKDGLVVCDSSFSFGCYHELLGRAIHYEGLGIVSDLNQKCFDSLGPNGLSCSHGLGHGIQSFLGYELPNLKIALAECGELTQSDPIGGCNGGVFMEYNVRTMLSLDGIGPREFDPETGAHYPCNVLSDEFQEACYYWQPQWWTTLQTDTMEETYAVMGEWCRELDSENLIRKCFEGIGNVAGQSSEYIPTDTIALCRSAVKDDAQHDLYCRSVAANTYYSVPEVRARSSEMCDGLEDDALVYCTNYSNNVFNQMVWPE